MPVLKRVRKVINWYIYQDIAENDNNLSEILGYTKSSFSQIINGKVPLSGKFIDKLSSLDCNINKVWILTGEGNMLLNNDNSIQEPLISYEKIIRDKDKIIELQSKEIARLESEVATLKKGSASISDMGIPTAELNSKST